VTIVPCPCPRCARFAECALECLEFDLWLTKLEEQE